MIYFTCPKCERIGQAPKHLAGRAIACPMCKQEMLVPHFVVSGEDVQEEASSEPQEPQGIPDQPRDGLLRFFCPNCRKKLKIPSHLRNGTTNCKSCGYRIGVNAALQTSPAPVSGIIKKGRNDQSLLAYLPDVIGPPKGQYYYTKGSKRLGPVSSATLRQLAQSGQLRPSDYIWKKGFANWKKAGAAKGLFPRTPPPPPGTPTNPIQPLPHQPVAAKPAQGAPLKPGSSPAAPVAALLPPNAQEQTVPASTAPPRSATGYSELIRKDPTNVLSYVQRGLALAEKEDHDRAIADLDSALRIDPQNAQALAARGLIYAKSKSNYHRGLADISAAIRFAPNETALYDLRAALFREIGDVVRADEDERRSAELKGK